MIRAVAYLRTSTDDQALGLEAQRAAIERWAAREGATVASWHADAGVSGGAPIDRRPALLEALDALRAARPAVLVVAKRDRLARDTLAAGMIERLAERAGGSVVSADGTGNGAGPEAQLFRSIVDAFAQYERALIRARTRAALLAKRARGESPGGLAPLGWRVEIRGDSRGLAPDPAEQRALAEAARLHEEGRPWREVSARLAAAGMLSRAGSPYDPGALRRAVLRARDFSPCPPARVE